MDIGASYLDIIIKDRCGGRVRSEGMQKGETIEEVPSEDVPESQSEPMTPMAWVMRRGDTEVSMAVSTKRRAREQDAIQGIKMRC